MTASPPPDPNQPPGSFVLVVKSITEDPAGKKVAQPHPIACHAKMSIAELTQQLSVKCGIPYEQVWLLLQEGQDNSKTCVFLKPERTIEEYNIHEGSAVWCFKRAPKQQVANEETMWRGVIHTLEQQGLIYHRSGGDGNCLFRSVSISVYGDEAHHGVVRQSCMDYMVAQAHAFEPAVAGDFTQYVQSKRMMDGSAASWGDEPELLAMSELYRRPVQVWTFFEDSTTGALEPQIFTKYEPILAPADALPIRVSFLGKGHYDALLPFSRQELTQALIQAPPGEYETATISDIRKRSEEEEAQLASSRAAFHSHSRAPLEEEILDKVRQESLLVLRRQASIDMEGAIAESMEEEISQIEQKFEDDATQAALQASAEENEAAQLKAVEQQQLAEAMEKSRRAQLVTDLQGMGIPAYEAEYAAQNAADIETALEFLNNAKHAGDQGSEAAKQLIALSGMPDMPIEQAQYYVDAAGGDLGLAFSLMSQ
eukprot:TRINITY_DN487_c0_g1_i2.p1 TRINITY_DN487_c0_g1~~TRINITY_DN487_c0_g1_i2.p1  ORF type:complete len:483 (-),score=126.94 TRINITY_DN487_c0_g1_i2:251-1699(-)